MPAGKAVDYICMAVITVSLVCVASTMRKGNKLIKEIVRDFQRFEGMADEMGKGLVQFGEGLRQAGNALQ